MNWEGMWEKSKEPLRWLALSIIPFLIAWATELTYEWAGIVVVGLRLLDKILHDKAPDGVSGGLTRF